MNKAIITSNLGYLNVPLIFLTLVDIILNLHFFTGFLVLQLWWI